MVKRKGIAHINKKEIMSIDPKATDDIEQNLAVGMDEIIPDPDDIPGGLNPDLTLRPDVTKAEWQALLEKKEHVKSTQKRKSKKK